MRILFIKHTLSWPRARGHDVHGYHLIRALGRLGHEVGLATIEEPTSEALEGLDLSIRTLLTPARPVSESGVAPTHLTRLQERLSSYWGFRSDYGEAAGELAGSWGADAVVAIGLDGPMYLAGVETACRVWYVADEYARHHLSLVRAGRVETWANLRFAAVCALYERACASLCDRIWVVSEGDRKSMRFVAGTPIVDVIANGVDGEYFRPIEPDPLRNSCVFWGRLDFPPNIQALEWFVGRVWPLLRREVPDARFSIYGYNPSPVIRELAGREGVSLFPDLPDLRAEVGRSRVVVLPLRSGGGIKNKLLEAASMGMAIVCTPLACNGLRGDRPPLLVAAPWAGRWARAVRSLWDDPDRSRLLGAEARLWVIDHHGWTAAAREATVSITGSLRGISP